MRFYLSPIAVGLLALGTPFLAAAQSFSDLPEDHFAYEAVEFLKTNGIIDGYADGTFKPGATVNRAEAIKLIITPLVTEEQMTQAKSAVSTFQDVPADSWYKPHVELARAAGVIDGPPAKTQFLGGNTVLKAEFIKMVQEAFQADPQTSFSEIRLPLSVDVTNPDEWFYPYMRYSIATSMTMVGEDGLLSPGKQLTRGETAVLLYRYIMFTDNRRTQALLSEAENEILNVLTLLEQDSVDDAAYASARALLAARGAHMSRPDEPVVKGAVKITEAFRAMVRAYRSGLDQDYEQVIKLAGDAWNLAERAKEFTDSLATIADQVQSISKNMADTARAVIAQQGESQE